MTGPSGFDSKTGSSTPVPGAPRSTPRPPAQPVFAGRAVTLPKVPVDAIARHASAEGCQFILTGPLIQPDARVLVILGSGDDLRATVRWRVGSRIGVAFDSTASDTILAELAAPFTKISVLSLGEISRD